jgi:hypothetical protein
MLSALAFTALLAAAAPPPDPAAGTAPPPPAPLAPDTTAPPPPSSSPAPAPSEATPSTPKPELKVAPAKEGMSPWVVGGIQWLTGCGVTALSVPCNFCTLGCWGCTVQPALIGYAETFAGDSLGSNRAAAIWPIVAAYAVGVIAFTVNLAIAIAAGGATSILANTTNGNPLANTPLIIANISAVGIGVIAGLAVPITYALVDVPKKPGDDGSGWPGLLEPGGPPAPSIKTKAEVKTTSTSMRY